MLVIPVLLPLDSSGMVSSVREMLVGALFIKNNNVTQMLPGKLTLPGIYGVLGASRSVKTNILFFP